MSIKMFLSIIFISVLIHNSISLDGSCITEGSFDENQMEGYWNHLIDVSPWSTVGKCSRLFLQHESKEYYNGYWYQNDDSDIITNHTFSARIDNDIFSFKYDDFENEWTDFFISTSRCDGKTEFILSNPENEWYYVFGKELQPSEIVLNKYQLLADDRELEITEVDHSNCEQ